MDMNYCNKEMTSHTGCQKNSIIQVNKLTLNFIKTQFNYVSRTLAKLISSVCQLHAGGQHNMMHLSVFYHIGKTCKLRYAVLDTKDYFQICRILTQVKDITVMQRISIICYSP